MVDNEVYKKLLKKVKRCFANIHRDYIETSCLLNNKKYSNPALAEISDKISKERKNRDICERKVVEEFQDIIKRICIGDKYERNSRNECFYRFPSGKAGYYLRFLENFTYPEFLNNLPCDVWMYDDKIKSIDAYECFKVINDFDAIKDFNGRHEEIKKCFEEFLQNAIEGFKRSSDEVDAFIKKERKKLEVLSRKIVFVAKFGINNKKTLEKLNLNKQACEEMLTDVYKLRDEISEIGGKLDVDVKEDFAELCLFKNKNNYIKYRTVSNNLNALCDKKEKMAEAFIEKSEEKKHLRELTTREYKEKLVKSCVDKESLKALKKDHNFLNELKNVKDEETTSVAESFLVKFLVKAIAPQQQEISK